MITTNLFMKDGGREMVVFDYRQPDERLEF